MFASNFRNTVTAVLGTIVFSATCIGAAVAPVKAATVATQTVETTATPNG